MAGQDVNFIDVLKEKKALVWPEINEYLDKLLDFPEYCQIPEKYSNLKRFHQQITADYCLRQGKYFRPSLILLTTAAMGYPEKKAVKTAAAMEICQNWILNHDDIEDDSQQRRGKPCLHRQVGTELAVNAGDALHILMWKVLKDNVEVVGEPTGLKIIEEFYRMLSRTAFGQTVEIKWNRDNKANLTINDILLILESKTGYYTMAGPMRLGAILAGANNDQLDKIYEFGKLIGFGFQIKDDLLDLTSDFQGRKKQQGNDIYEGKRTIMLIHLMKNIDKTGQKKLISILDKNRKEKSKSEVDWVMGKMNEFGSIDYARKMMEKFIDQADKYFDKELIFLNQQPACRQLKAFIDLQKSRQY
jgi:geranylgeranyl diphosphate synthase type II